MGTQSQAGRLEHHSKKGREERSREEWAEMRAGGETKESRGRVGQRWWAAAGDDYDSQAEPLAMLQFPRSLVHSITRSLAHTVVALRMDTCGAPRAHTVPLNQMQYL